MTHAELVEKAYKWVLNRTSCGVAFKELHTTCCNGEYPDVIGFGSWGHSVVVECKTSLSDFRADAKKLFRREPRLGMGRYRFYMCPRGLISVEQLPEKWGLIYVDEKGRSRCIYNPYSPRGGNIWVDGFEQNMKAEHGFMYSALRRLHYRGVLDTVYAQKELH